MTPLEVINDNDTAWVQHMIVADDMRLDDFLAELNRHRQGSLGCDDSIAGLKVSGTYPLEDTDKVIDMVRNTLRLEVKSLTRFWVRLFPANQPG